jgi:Skp family chaperone for outer membrane proteins
MLLINILFLSTLIVNNDFHYTKPFINNFESSKFHLISNDFEFNKIGIVDFRKVLRISNSMQILGKKFISAEKKLNQKFNLKQVTLKEKEKEILKQKKIVSIEKYNSIIKLFKKEVFEIQSNNKQERLILNNSFQKIQKNLKDLLANVIKEISMKKNINIVLLKENIFILNDQSADLTDEVLNSFNKKTKNIKIKIIIAD